jgi:hypothetical protein
MGTAKRVEKPRQRKWGAKKYTPELARAICEALITDFGGLVAVLEELKKAGKNPPNVVNVWRWRTDVPGFDEMYTRARQMHAELDLDEAHRVSREAMKGEIVTQEYEKGRLVSRTVKTVDNVQRAQLLATTLFKRAALMYPQRYGDKLEVSGTVEFASRIAAARERAGRASL